MAESKKPCGKVVAINLSDRKGTKKLSVEGAVLRPDHGFVGDAHAGIWHRQVSLLAEESIDKMRQKGLTLKSGDFAENITTRGISLLDLSIGTRVRVGEAILEVTQHGKECHSHCEIFRQVGDCVMPREGIFARVLKGGQVEPGSEVCELDPTEVVDLPKRSKQDIRRAALAMRRALKPEDAIARSVLIKGRLLAMPEYREATTIHTYVSSRDNEVDSHGIIQDALASGKRVVVPVAHVKERKMTHVVIRSLDDLKPGTFGILEPELDRAQSVAPEEIDLVIVPGIAFDRRGGRIGYGGGFYDRFLAAVRCPKVALAFTGQLCEEVPMDEHDVRVDTVVTEEEIVYAQGYTG